MATRQLSLLLAVLGLALVLAGCGGDEASSGATVGRITGTVHEDALLTGARAAGEAVTVSVEGTTLTTRAATDGRFTLNNVPAGLQTLVARTSRRAYALVVAVEQGKETHVGDMVLRAAGQLSGLVTAADAGDPIAGARVTVSELIYTLREDDMPHPVRLTRTDAAGSYTVAGLPVGQYLVTIDKEGYAATSLALQVNTGATTVGDARLTATASGETGGMAGAVFLQPERGEARPLGGVLIRLWPTAQPEDSSLHQPVPVTTTAPGQVPPPEPCPREYYTFSAEDGTYTLSGVPVGDYRAMAVRPGLQEVEQHVTITANAVAKVNFTLVLRALHFAAIDGTVADAETGEPVAGASVRAIMTVPPTAAQDKEAGGVVVTPGDCVMEAITDPQGRYKLLVPAAVTAVAVFARGYEPREAPVTVVPDGAATVDIALTPAHLTQVVLSGRVTMKSPDAATLVPVASAQVHIQPTGDVPDPAMRPVSQYTATTDAEGKYEVTIPADIYLVQVTKDAYRAPAVWLALYAHTTQDFVLERGNLPPPPPPTLR